MQFNLPPPPDASTSGNNTVRLRDIKYAFSSIRKRHSNKYSHYSIPEAHQQKNIEKLIKTLASTLEVVKIKWVTLHTF